MSTSSEDAIKSHPTEEPTVPTFWIMGDSFVQRGATRAAQTLGPDLGLAARVRWFGRDGLLWNDLLPFVLQTLQDEPTPDLLLICCGSGDLGKTKSVGLVKQMKLDLQNLHQRLPGLTLAWSELTDRRQWGNARPGRIGKAKRFVNNVMRECVRGLGGCVVSHPVIKFYCPGLFLSDGVHFSALGNDIFLKSIATALKNHCHQV